MGLNANFEYENSFLYLDDIFYKTNTEDLQISLMRKMARQICTVCKEIRINKLNSSHSDTRCHTAEWGFILLLCQPIKRNSQPLLGYGAWGVRLNAF